MPSNYLVVSSDGHAGPPAQVYRDYLDPRSARRSTRTRRRSRPAA